MVAAGNHPRADALGDPGLDHEVADVGLHPHEITGADAAQSVRITWMQPERVGVRNLIEPL